MFLLSFLMVSHVKYRSFKDINLKQPHPGGLSLWIALIIFGIALNPAVSLLQ